MEYEAKNFDNILGTTGFSDTLLKNHFALYQGYVKNTNLLIGTLTGCLSEGKTAAHEFAELKRRFGWEWNGMRLHEYYFGNMKNPVASRSAFQTSSEKGGFQPDKDSEIFKKIEEDFDSYENWEKEFRAMGTIRGIGWVILYFDPVAQKLINVWINEHHTGHLAGGIPILVMDVFEHAYMLDYGVTRAGYIDAFFKAINWEAAVERFSIR